jgi:chorismate-pyruvate lyase
MTPESFNEITWWKRLDFLEHCRSHPVPLPLRLLLASDGTVVGYLTALFSEPVTIEGVEHRNVALERKDADLFQQPEGTEGVLRRGWLVQERTRRAHALSFFPKRDLSPGFHQEMIRSALPLGSLIEAQGLFVRRERIEICSLRHPRIAKELGCGEEEALWGRRYRLIISNEASASIFEVFSPRLGGPSLPS